jgi:hypothetical protein
MKHFKYSVSLLMILMLFLVFTGCAKPPEAEKSAAKTAMDTAIASGADKYAAADLAAAKKVWENAEAQMKEKKYKEAGESYLAAKVSFEKATGAVGEGKKLVFTEVKAAIVAMEVSGKQLKVIGGNALKKITDKKERAAQKESLESDIKAFADGLKEAKEKIESDPAAAKAKIVVLKSIMDKWSVSQAEQKDVKDAAVTPASAPVTTPAKAQAPVPATAKAQAAAPATAKVKVIGNSDSKRYHLPGMKYYNAVKANHRVEFNSEEEAVKAGYTKAPK